MVHFLNEYALMRSTALSRGTLAKIQCEMLPLNEIFQVLLTLYEVRRFFNVPSYPVRRRCRSRGLRFIVLIWINLNV